MITCTFEDNGTASLRHVVTDGIVLKEDKIVLVKRGEELLESGKYAMPGGYLDRDETTEEGIRREIMEETGYEVKKTILFRIITKANRKGEDRQNVSFVYIVEVGETTGESDHEVEKVELFSLDALPSEEEFAFDHYESIELYLRYRKENHSLPLTQ